MLAQPLDIRDQVRSVVARKIHLRRTRMRRASSAIALIKQNDSICEWIEQPAMPRRASRSGTAMQHDGRLAARITARLPVDAVAVANLEHAVIVRFDRWVQVRHDDQIRIWTGVCRPLEHPRAAPALPADAASGSLHVNFEAHPRMNAAFEEMLALRQASDVEMTALKDSRPGHRDVTKAAGTLRNNAGRAAGVERR